MGMFGLPPSVTILHKNKKFVRIVTRAGMWFDLEKDDDFNMVAFISSVKATGHILLQELYQPLDFIATIFVWSEDTPPKQGEGVVLSFPKDKT